MEVKSIDMGAVETLGELRQLTRCFTDETKIVCQRPGRAGYVPLLVYVLGETEAQLEIA